MVRKGIATGFAAALNKSTYLWLNIKGRLLEVFIHDAPYILIKYCLKHKAVVMLLSCQFAVFISDVEIMKMSYITAKPEQNAQGLVCEHKICQHNRCRDL